MAWINPTVAGVLAFTASHLVLAQTDSKIEEKWNFSGAKTVAEATDIDQVEDVAQSQEIEESEPAQDIDAELTVESEIPSKPTPVADLESGSDANVDDGTETTSDEAAEDVAVAELDPDSKYANEELSTDGFWTRDGPELLSEEDEIRANKLEKAQRRSNLEQQLAKLQKTLETADAFSLELAEDYFGYGMLLRDSGQYDEAVEAFVDALHIQKVNHGIYAPEQRPALKALFETHYALGNVEDFEDYLERILWVESKNPDLSDDFSYKMLIMVGNRYIDQFLKRPIAGQASVQTLLRAKHHLNAAFKRHKDKPLTVALMPYGELALISFLESQLLDDVDKTASMEDPRLRGSRNLDGRELALASYLSNSFPRGTGLLRSYLKKAQTEENLPHVVRALVALGDFNQLFRRHTDAEEYYKVAWKQAQNLPVDHPARSLMATPTPLPAFDYALEREPILPTKPTLLIPVKVNVAVNGRVTDVERGDEEEQTDKYFSRARRLARQTVFRPKMVDGELQAATDLLHKQRVYARKGS